MQIKDQIRSCKNTRKLKSGEAIRSFSPNETLIQHGGGADGIDGWSWMSCIINIINGTPCIHAFRVGVTPSELLNDCSKLGSAASFHLHWARNVCYLDALFLTPAASVAPGLVLRVSHFHRCGSSGSTLAYKESLLWNLYTWQWWPSKKQCKGRKRQTWRKLERKMRWSICILGT